MVDFHNVVLEHCARETNRVPHELASITRVHSPEMWTENPPDAIARLIFDDLSLFEMI